MRRCIQSNLATICNHLLAEESGAVPLRIAVLAFAFLAFLILVVVLGGLAWAQDASTGALRGSVLDAQGAAVMSADVVLISVDTGIRYHAATDLAGRFVLDLLPPGTYSARAEAEGMSPQVSPAIKVEVGAAQWLTFRLSVAGPQETVTVSGTPPIVDPSPTGSSVLLDERAIADLPLGGRRYTELLLLTPGVTQDPRGLTSGSNGDLSYGGIRGYNTSYTIDGTDDNNGFFAQARGRYRAPYQFSNEVVQEFRVSSNSYGAESGRSGGAVVNIVTKSGSNYWHGSAFYYLRDSSLGGAAPPFVGFNPNSQQHQFGGTFGGPIQRNKTFFLAGYDQHIFHLPTVVQFQNGQMEVTPALGTPGFPLDYEVCDPHIGGSACDQTLVGAAAAQLSGQAGVFRAEMLGNTGFLKFDHVLGTRHLLSARLSTSRYYGQNNVFLDPSSPVTNDALSGNGQENVTTESGALTLTSSLTPRWISHLRAQFSRDLQQSFPNSTATRTEIYNWISDMGQSSILPRQTREHRLHLAETMSFTRGRNEWKFGGDLMRTWDYNYFPSLFGGEYIFDYISVNPWTFVPMQEGVNLTPLRAWAHTIMPSWDFDSGSWTGPVANLPRYYIQNFGNPVSHPNSNDYAAFAQDTVRLTSKFSASLGVRYDRQTFSKEGMVSDPLWPLAGHMPEPAANFAPRIGLAYAIGDKRPVVLRAGFGIFYTRIPQLYESAVINGNGVTNQFLELDNTDLNQTAIFPQFPNAAAKCAAGPVECALPSSLAPFATAEVSAFGPGFKTPRVQQASLRMERELSDGFTGELSYLFVHGIDLIRARDVNLPPPTDYSYPVFDSTGSEFQNAFYDVQSFSAWQTSYSLTCPYPPCLNPLQRPIAQLGAIDQFESAASSVYHGLTVSLQKRMSAGLAFRLAYTWAHAIDDGQDALVAGQPATVQNSYAANSERGPSVTDQRNRLTVALTEEPRLFDSGQKILAAMFNHWKVSGVMTYGSGRPANANVYGDPNQDDNTSNDRLAGYGRNAFVGPDYATLDLRLGKRVKIRRGWKLDLNVESFNLFNRDNKTYLISDTGFYNSAGEFVKYSQYVGGTYYPAYYQRPTNFLRLNSAFAPRQLQLSTRLNF
ncbi:MAG TPA: TonB-dependent receptor [Terriglobales bacterium]|nr:TonB-dependent receptor [Terriglobales bacterium]